MHWILWFDRIVIFLSYIKWISQAGYRKKRSIKFVRHWKCVFFLSFPLRVCCCHSELRFGWRFAATIWKINYFFRFDEFYFCKCFTSTKNKVFATLRFFCFFFSSHCLLAAEEGNCLIIPIKFNLYQSFHTVSDSTLIHPLYCIWECWLFSLIEFLGN